MQFIRQVRVPVYQCDLRITVYKLFVKAITVGSFIISIRDISNGYGLGTMVRTYPVRIRQIDADSRCRIKITGKDSCSYHFRRNSFHLIFPEPGIYRRMIFKPLRIAANHFRTVCSLQILEINKRFPTGLHAERITVAFGKTIYEINTGVQVFHPQNGVFVKSL